MKRLKKKKRESTLKTLRRMPSQIQRIFIMEIMKVDPILIGVLEVLHEQNITLLIGSINPFKVTIFFCNIFGHKAVDCRVRKRRNSKIGRSFLPQRNNTMLFHGYCFSCNNYGHKVDECKSKVKRNNSVLEHNIVCYKCNNIGHKPHYCRNGFVKPSAQYLKNDESFNQQKRGNKKIWNEDHEKKDDSTLVHSAQDSKTN